MDIRFNCPQCKAEYSTDADNVGKTAKCKKCESIITIPNNPSYYKNHSIRQPEKQNLKKTNKFFKAILTIFGFVVLIIIMTLSKELGRNAIRIILRDYKQGQQEINNSDRTINTLLKTISQNVNSKCPIANDRYTTLLNVTVFDKKITYSYKLDLDVLMRDSQLSITKLRQNIKEKITNDYCSNPKFDIFREYNIIMIYKYSDLKNNHLFSFEISKNVCIN